LYTGRAKAFLAKLLQELHCGIHHMEMSVVVKDNFFFKQARVFHPDAILQVLQYCTVGLRT
jgi:hypothetical protein